MPFSINNLFYLDSRMTQTHVMAKVDNALASAHVESRRPDNSKTFSLPKLLLSLLTCSFAEHILPRTLEIFFVVCQPLLLNVVV